MARIENKRITISKATLTTWKSNQILNLNPEARTNVSFGLGKGMVVLENLAELCAFLKSDGKSLELPEDEVRKIKEFAAQYLPKQEG